MHKGRGLTLATMLTQMKAAVAPAAPPATGTSQFSLLLLHRKVPKVEYLLKMLLTFTSYM